MIKIIKVSNPAKFIKHTSSVLPDTSKIQSIIHDIQSNGDAAVRKYEEQFSRAILGSLLVSPSEIRAARLKVTDQQLSALSIMRERLERTERAILSTLKDIKLQHDNITISKTFVPLDTVGCYVPGGLARYPSSAIMSIVPAKIARVRNILVTTPPDSTGKIDPLTITAAKMCGATAIYKAGGVQAIAAMAYGTRSIPKVDKIVGPGGPFVTAAKHLVSGTTSIDMTAGPTELGIIADSGTDPRLVALDLISQAEHSNDTSCFVITDSKILADDINKNLKELIPSVSRSDIVSSSIKSNGFIAVCKDRSDIIKLGNILAPEHLQIMTRSAAKLATKFTTAGLVLVGKYTPSAASDYLLGSNHILPTSGLGRARGSLSVLDFVKLHTSVTSSKDTLHEISCNMESITRSEDLTNHYLAVKGRL